MIKIRTKLDIDPHIICVPRFLEFPAICQACCNKYKCLTNSNGKDHQGLCPPMVMNVQCHFSQIFFHEDLDPIDNRIRYLNSSIRNKHANQEAYLSILYIDEKPYRVVIGHHYGRNLWLILQLSLLQKHEAGELLSLSKDPIGPREESAVLPYGLSMDGYCL
jgi:hypothetical protein